MPGIKPGATDTVTDMVPVLRSLKSNKETDIKEKSYQNKHFVINAMKKNYSEQLECVTICIINQKMSMTN